MDGFKKRIAQSIQYRLSFWLIVIISLMALLAVITSYKTALHEAREMQDNTLKQIAILVSKNQLNIPANEFDHKAAGIIIQHLSDSQSVKDKPSAEEVLVIPTHFKDGFHTLGFGKKTYRIIILGLSNQQRIAVAQLTTLRDEAAQTSAILTILPMIFLIPILLGVVFLLVRQAIKPVSKLAMDIQNRKMDDLTPLSLASIPSEISPFVAEINQLLARVAHSIETQRRFVADAAHELRSPLTALSLQAERLADSKMSLPAQECLSTLRQGIERGRMLLEQLLTLARVQAKPNQQEDDISIHGVFVKVLEDLIQQAETKNIDIGVKQVQDVTLKMSEADLVIVVKNLVENAIKFTPNGGHIDLSVSTQANKVVIEVEDNGCGIPDDERNRVFDPFYRVVGNQAQGSGLGLSIVQAVLERVGGSISLTKAENFTTGLKATVSLNRYH